MQIGSITVASFSFRVSPLLLRNLFCVVGYLHHSSFLFRFYLHLSSFGSSFLFISLFMLRILGLDFISFFLHLDLSPKRVDSTTVGFLFISSSA